MLYLTSFNIGTRSFRINSRISFVYVPIVKFFYFQFFFLVSILLLCFVPLLIGSIIPCDTCMMCDLSFYWKSNPNTKIWRVNLVVECTVLLCQDTKNDKYLCQFAWFFLYACTYILPWSAVVSTVSDVMISGSWKYSLYYYFGSRQCCAVQCGLHNKTFCKVTGYRHNVFVLFKRIGIEIEKN